MSDLTSIEKIKLERLFEMGSGYVLDFSNRTFQEFFFENMGIDIYDEKYDYASGSKANQLWAFWNIESNYLVGKLISEFLDYWKTKISILESFNNVRNNQSFAHDNPILNYNESILIFNNVSSSIRFIESIEEPDVADILQDEIETDWDDIPF